MSDRGLTHVALAVTDMERSLEFYETYAEMKVVHRRHDGGIDSDVAWISDGTRPFVIVLIKMASAERILGPIAHLGVGCESRARVDELCAKAIAAGIEVEGPNDSGPPVGYWAFLHDPDGHTLELSHGQEVGLTVEGK